MKQRGNKKKIIQINKNNLWDLLDNVKHPNIWIIGVLEEETPLMVQQYLQENVQILYQLVSNLCYFILFNSSG